MPEQVLSAVCHVDAGHEAPRVTRRGRLSASDPGSIGRRRNERTIVAGFRCKVIPSPAPDHSGGTQNHRARQPRPRRSRDDTEAVYVIFRWMCNECDLPRPCVFDVWVGDAPDAAMAAGDERGMGCPKRIPLGRVAWKLVEVRPG